jgi:hypothetical protein
MEAVDSMLLCRVEADKNKMTARANLVDSTECDSE